MSYREQLPEGCPPDEAEEINTRREVFRLVRNRTPTEEDFDHSAPRDRAMHSAASPSAKRVDCRFTLSVALQSGPCSSPASPACAGASSVDYNWKLVQVAFSRPAHPPTILGGRWRILIF